MRKLSNSEAELKTSVAYKKACNAGIDIILCRYCNISKTALPPWWGRIFEGMVRPVKRCLKKILLGARIPFEELETVLREIELT